MARSRYNPSGSNQPKSASSKNMALLLAIIAIVGLLGLNGFQWYQSGKIKQEIASNNEEILEIEKINAELEQDYESALNNLEEMRAENQDLSSEIDKQKADLAEKKAQISRMISEGNDLKDVRLELENLKTQAQISVQEIKRLREENNQLVLQNTNLSEKNQTLQINQENTLQELAEVETEKEVLIEKTEILSSKYQEMASKVNLASLVKIQDIELRGLKYSRKGKAKKTSRAKDIEVLQTCFTTEENNITELEEESFKIRIIDPIGETIYLEDSGSGVFTNQQDQTEVRYTIEASIPYAKEEAKACIDFRPGYSIPKGKYTVEMYNKGFFAGAGEFKIK